MDTSEIYVKMCDCEEVQSREPYFGETSRDFHYWGKEEGNWDYCTWLPRQDQIQEMMPQKLPGNLGTVETKAEWWQDDKRMIVFNLVNEFRHFWDEKQGYIRKIAYEEPTSFSMEQLWLVFYMHEKYDKTWDGEKWA